jgi:hypothetical protein
MNARIDPRDGRPRPVAAPAFQLRVPVVAAPMFLVSGPDMVLAACRAGLIGAFPAQRPAHRDAGAVDAPDHRGLVRARDEQPQAPIGPWCANLVTHSSNTRLAEDLALVAKYQPPLVVTALGSPKPAIDVVQGYGGRVIADVVNLTLARKAIDAGADGLACICHGAGATPARSTRLPSSARCASASTAWSSWAAASATAGAWPAPSPAGPTWSTWARASSHGGEHGRPGLQADAGGQHSG